MRQESELSDGNYLDCYRLLNTLTLDLMDFSLKCCFIFDIFSAEQTENKRKTVTVRFVFVEVASAKLRQILSVVPIMK